MPRVLPGAKSSVRVTRGQTLFWRRAKSPEQAVCQVGAEGSGIQGSFGFGPSGCIAWGGF